MTAATHIVDDRKIAVIDVLAKVWTHKDLPSGISVERHPRMGWVMRLTLDQFYAWIRWHNGVLGAECPDFAEYVSTSNLMATVDHLDSNQFDTWAQYWFQPATKHTEAEVGLGIGSNGRVRCWERRNRI